MLKGDVVANTLTYTKKRLYSATIGFNNSSITVSATSIPNYQKLSANNFTAGLSYFKGDSGTNSVLSTTVNNLTVSYNASSGVVTVGKTASFTYATDLTKPTCTGTIFVDCIYAS